MKEYEDKSFNVVFSNSVIEHVGSFTDQLKMANEMLRIGQWVFCQMPNRYFPIEPHTRSYVPWWELMPLSAKVRSQKRVWHCTELVARLMVDDTHLLRKRDLALLFPGLTIKKEKILFLTKSYIVFGK